MTFDLHDYAARVCGMSGPGPGSFSPPEHKPTPNELARAEEREDRRLQLFAQAMQGAGDFWDIQRLSETEDWVRIIRAVKRAHSVIGLSGDERDNIIQAALRLLADQWAQTEVK